LFISRFIPVVRHLVSIPAGIGKMRLLPFVLATVLGSTLWNSFLLVCGMFLRDHWRVVMTYSHEVDIVVGAVLLAGVIWFVKSRYKMRKQARWAEVD
jgi:membrane protein DedA with SNARE-associated domain